MTSTPSLNAVTNSLDVIVPQLDNDVLILRNISSNKIPLVPPIEEDIESATSENSKEGWSSCNFPDSSRCKISFAPRSIVIPQSPSPTMVSYFVSNGSASMSAFEHAAIILLDTPAKSFKDIEGNDASLPAAVTPGTSSTSVSDGREEPSVQMSTWFQAGALVSASINDKTFLVSPTNGMIETEAPCISNEVINAPTNTRVALHPTSFSSWLTMLRANKLISKLLVPPKLFTKTSNSSPELYSGTFFESTILP